MDARPSSSSRPSSGSANDKEGVITEREGWIYVKAIIKLLSSKGVDKMLQIIRKDNWDWFSVDAGVNLYEVIMEDQRVPRNRKPSAMKNYLKVHVKGEQPSVFLMFEDKLKREISKRDRKNFRRLVQEYRAIDVGPRKPFTSQETLNYVTCILDSLKEGASVAGLRKCLSNPKKPVVINGRSIWLIGRVKTMTGSYRKRSSESFRSKWRQFRRGKQETLTLAQPIKKKYSQAVWGKLEQLLS